MGRIATIIDVKFLVVPLLPCKTKGVHFSYRFLMFMMVRVSIYQVKNIYIFGFSFTLCEELFPVISYYFFLLKYKFVLL